MTQDEQAVPAHWGFAEQWNKALSGKEEREITPRDYLWASELGKSPIDVYLRLKGTVPSNPPNDRAKRKFEAGNVSEWIVGLILKRAGILKDQQEYCTHQYEGLLKVTGKADYLAGGKPDLEKFRDEIDTLEMPEVFKRAGEAVVAHLQEHFPNGLVEMPLEIKSCSSFVADMMEKTNKPLRNHRKQLFHYLKSTKREVGRLIYICRDDLRIFEFVVMNPSFVEDEYRGDIEVITKYFNNNEEPPKEKLVLFDEEEGKFSKNFNVEYSNYLTLLYEFVEPRDYSETYGKMASSFNRVMKRMKDGEKITDKNKIIQDQMIQHGFNPFELVSKFRSSAEDEQSEA